MYILLALITACVLGIAAHYLLPHRDLRGVVLTPAISTAAAGIIYTAMQWAGVGENSVWIWVASIFGALVVAAVATFALTERRRSADAAAKAALGI